MDLLFGSAQGSGSGLQANLIQFRSVYHNIWTGWPLDLYQNGLEGPVGSVYQNGLDGPGICIPNLLAAEGLALAADGVASEAEFQGTGDLVSGGFEGLT